MHSDEHNKSYKCFLIIIIMTSSKKSIDVKGPLIYL